MVRHIAVSYKPVTPIIQKLLNIHSDGEFAKNLEGLGLTDITHPSMALFFDNDDPYPVRLERNALVQVSKLKPEKNSVTSGLMRVNKSLGELIENHRQYLGGSFDNILIYNAQTNNSQVYVKGFLEANGLLTGELLNFFRQDTEEIMRAMPETNALITRIVLLGASIDSLLGKGVDE